MEVSESGYVEKGNIQFYNKEFPFGYHEYHTWGIEAHMFYCFKTLLRKLVAK